MKPEIKQRWINALRSGKYKQGIGCLRQKDKYCCLGVLVDLYAKEDKGQWELQDKEHYVFYLTDRVEACLFGLPEAANFTMWCGGVPDAVEKQLTYLNDIKRTNFGLIADWIEENL